MGECYMHASVGSHCCARGLARVTCTVLMGAYVQSAMASSSKHGVPFTGKKNAEGKQTLASNDAWNHIYVLVQCCVQCCGWVLLEFRLRTQPAN